MNTKDLVKQYPFLEINKKCTENNYTWLNDLEEGWNKSFGLDFCKELSESIKKDNCIDTFKFIQIKEKYGELCLHASGYGDNTKEILEKYCTLSKYICAKCGKPARYITTGWICPLCENCINTVNGNYKKIEDFYKFNSYDDVLKEINKIKTKFNYKKWFINF